MNRRRSSIGVFLIFLSVISGSGFSFSAILPGPSLQRMRRCGVADRHAFQPYRSRTGPPKHGLRLKPPAPDGTRTQATRTIPSRPDLPLPLTHRQVVGYPAWPRLPLMEDWFGRAASSELCGPKFEPLPSQTQTISPRIQHVLACQ